MIRLLGALERLPVDRKIEARVAFGQALRPARSGRRLGAGPPRRAVPVAGAAHRAVPPDVATSWLEALLALDFRLAEDAPFAWRSSRECPGTRA